MTKTILVTGGAGYVGAILVPKLLSKGYKVRVLDLFLYADKTIFSAEALESKSLELFDGDLCDDEIMRRAVSGTDCIINLAGVSNDPSSDLDPELTARVNIDATKALIDFGATFSFTRLAISITV